MIVPITVKHASAATWHHQPLTLGGHIPEDGSVSSINHLQWPVACKCQPPATYMCRAHPKWLFGWPVATLLEMWQCQITMLFACWLAENYLLLLLASIDPISTIVEIGCLLAHRNICLIACAYILIEFLPYERDMSQQFCIAGLPTLWEMCNGTNQFV